MKTRIIVSAVLLPIFFLVLFVFPPLVLTVVISAICAIAAYELLHATKIINKRVIVYTIIAAVFTPLAVYLTRVAAMSDDGTVNNDNISIMLHFTLLFSIFFILICQLLIELALTFKNKKAEEKGTKLKLRQIPITIAAGMLIPYLLSALISLKTMPYGHLFVLLPIVAAFVTDSGAYFTGVTIGKTKAFPTISPNKTVEGYIGGIISGIIGMLIYGVILSSTTPLIIIYPALIFYGILGAIMTELGDLTFSLIKRKCGIKDYGKLIPGHGGALDRFDSMTFAAPTMFLLVIAIPAIIF